MARRSFLGIAAGSNHVVLAHERLHTLGARGAVMPEGLSQVLVGPATAREIEGTR